MTKAFIVLQTNTLVGGKNAFCAIVQSLVQNAFFFLYDSAKHFSAGDKHIESARSNFHPTQLHM